jgi:tetratricopeptide (TPR) repeat protein
MAADERGGVNQRSEYSLGLSNNTDWANLCFSGRMLARKFQASIHRRLRDHARAIRILQEALTLTPTLKCSEGDAALFEAAVLNELAQCYQEIGAQRQAAPLLEQALKALVACFGEHDAEVATVMHNLGCLELELGTSFIFCATLLGLPACNRSICQGRTPLDPKHQSATDSAWLYVLAGVNLRWS